MAGAATAAALTIAGSDSGGGAGIQADLKAFSARGVYGASAITAVTAQNTRAVTAIHPLPPSMIRAQIDAVLSDIAIQAVKIGMLGTAEATRAVAEALQAFRGKVVLDPVMIAKSGDALLSEDAVSALVAHLLPRADLLTPNLPEAARLLGASEARDAAEAVAQGRGICELGAKAVLMKGGHAEGANCEDILITPGSITVFSAPRIKTRNTHGTGCTLSSAIAAELAKGKPLEEAVGAAHRWLHGAIVAADRLNIGAGHGPVHHFHEVWS